MTDKRPDILKESRLLRYAAKLDTQMNYMRKLISLINVENLTQVNITQVNTTKGIRLPWYWILVMFLVKLDLDGLFHIVGECELFEHNSCVLYVCEAT